MNNMNIAMKSRKIILHFYSQKHKRTHTRTRTGQQAPLTHSLIIITLHADDIYERKSPVYKMRNGLLKDMCLFMNPFVILVPPVVCLCSNIDAVIMLCAHKAITSFLKDFLRSFLTCRISCSLSPSSHAGILSPVYANFNSYASHNKNFFFICCSSGIQAMLAFIIKGCMRDTSSEHILAIKQFTFFLYTLAFVNQPSILSLALHPHPHHHSSYSIIQQ